MSTNACDSIGYKTPRVVSVCRCSWPCETWPKGARYLAVGACSCAGFSHHSPGPPSEARRARSLPITPSGSRQALARGRARTWSADLRTSRCRWAMRCSVVEPLLPFGISPRDVPRLRFAGPAGQKTHWYKDCLSFLIPVDRGTHLGPPGKIRGADGTAADRRR
jgi:hypothetical protein